MYKLICTLCLGIAISFISQAQNSNDSNYITTDGNIESPLQRILLLQPVQFEYTREAPSVLKFPKGLQYGISTSSIANQFPTLNYNRAFKVMQGKNRYVQQSYTEVNLEGLVPVLVAAIQEQQQQIEEISRQLEALRTQ